MATVKTIRRVILLNGKELPMPTKMSYEEAVQHYKARYPSLQNSYLGEQRSVNDKDGRPTKMVFETITKTGTKG